MKEPFASLLLTIVSTLPIFADNLPLAGKIFAHLNYTYIFSVKREEGLGPFKVSWTEWPVAEHQSLQKGSFWAVQTPDKTVLVTAAHIVGVNWKPTEIPNGPKFDSQNA